VYEVYASDSGRDNAALTSRTLELVRYGRSGIVTDVDGTISPIAQRPEQAFVLPEARTALEGLRDRLRVVAIVTGRSVNDARRMVGVDGLTYIGNHGLEVFTGGHAEIAPEARPWIPRLATLLAQISGGMDPALTSGVIVENKGATATLHYRLTPRPDRAREHLLELLADCAAASDLRVEEGRRVINLLPSLTVSKGSAVTWLVREHALDAVAYLGDDLTDTHAFRALDLLRQTGDVKTLAIGVVGPETPPIVRQLADATVPSVTAAAELLCGVLEGLKSSDSMNSRAPGVGSK
jgi:trehalose 6-phosphate phosphatase